MIPYLETATIPPLPDPDNSVHGGERTLLFITALIKYAPLGDLQYSWVNPDGSTSFASSEEPGDRLIDDALRVACGFRSGPALSETRDQIADYCRTALRLLGR